MREKTRPARPDGRWRPRWLVVVVVGLALATSERDADASQEQGSGQASPHEAPVEASHRPLVSPEPWTAGRHLLALRLGVASPVGEVGLSYAYSWVPWLESEIGIGLGFTGVQHSFMQRIVVGRSRVRCTAGVGASVAVPRSRETTGHPVWLNLDFAGLEIRATRHVLFFVAGGLTVGLGGGRVMPLFPSDSSSSMSQAGIVLPQLSLGVGAWF